MQRFTASKLLPPPNYRRNVAQIFGDNIDIQNTIERYLPEAIEQTKLLAPYFVGKSDYETGFNVWQFLRNELKYRIDSPKSQDIRLPNFLIASGIGDCKSFALFSAAILINLGYRVAFVYSGYKSDTTTPTHIYIDYAKTYQDLQNPQRKQLYSSKNLEASQGFKKNFWILDGVYRYFDSEKPPKSIRKKIII